MSFEVFTVEELAFAAVVACAAELAVVGRDLFADAETLNVLAEGDDFAGGFVAGDVGEAGDEVAVEDVEVGAANACALEEKFV